MINLLLPEEQKKRRVEYRHRLFVVMGWLFASWLIIYIVIIGTLYFIINLKSSDVNRALTEVEKQLSTQGIDKLALAIEEANDQLDRLNLEKKSSTPSSVLRHLTDSLTGGIKLSKIGYAGGESETKLELSGTSSTRQAFLNYLEILRADKIFSKVESPIANLIKERDLDFNLTLWVTKV